MPPPQTSILTLSLEWAETSASCRLAPLDISLNAFISRSCSFCLWDSQPSFQDAVLALIVQNVFRKTLVSAPDGPLLSSTLQSHFLLLKGVNSNVRRTIFV
ncbi:hypothetical protein RRG08_009421 [Elysia crispata]|uniref:Uncharacterized protein n=1 Tax=Elysia crispata TaxID=231223 RepID=A0AAE1CUW6_9GAST|nr:hypothetical protein RRG08_009421 [Elysia crispata]